MTKFDTISQVIEKRVPKG